MYFINTRKKITSSAFLLHILPAGTVLVTVFALTLLGWRNAREAYNSERETSVSQVVNDTQRNIKDKLSTYELMLLGASGLFVSSQDVTRDEWRSFTDSFDVPRNYPGVQGVGYMARVTTDEIPELVQSVRSEGLRNFKVHPMTNAQEHAVIKYLMPHHVDGLGYDMYSHPARKSALDTAKKSGTATISDRVVYKDTEMPFSGVGFSMYLPVYESSTQRKLDETQRDTKGYVFAPFLADDFFAMTLDKSTGTTDAIRIYDGSDIDPDNLLFESDNFAALDNPDSIMHTQEIELFGQKWVLDFRISQDIVAETTRNRPLSSLIVGTMLSLLLSGFVLTLLVARTRVLAHSKQMEVQSAKDELLSLASHQLRTPATSVKQYVGMALEGFAGKLSAQQANLLEKAYESNERQLHIINEILYVAKIDAQGIVLTPRRINLNKLLRELTQELSTTAKKSNQKIRLQMPLKQVHIEADEYCLRMAAENLISNALKYSYEGGTVSVKLASTKSSVRLMVRDKGVGIDQDDLPLLFQRFSRIPNELSRQTSGSGIGLYLSQQLIHLHNGTISVESTKGKGTTFIVTLPKTYNPEA